MESERLHPEPISLEISGCSKEDARIVFDSLCAYFDSDRCSDDVPRDWHEVRPTVWLGTYEVAAPHEGAHPATPRLSASVEADAHGGYWAIDRFRTTLHELFRVHDLSTASGDQERELHVRLENR